MNIRFLFTALVGALLSVPSFAQVDAKLSPEFSKCMEKSGGVDPAMIDCYEVENALQDKRLNDAYRKFIAKLDPTRRKALTEVQRLWLRYSDANCDFWYDPNGGTAARMASNDCYVRSRAARAGELEELARIQSGSTP